MDVSKDRQLSIWFYILLPPSTGMKALSVFPALVLKIQAGKSMVVDSHYHFCIPEQVIG